jgi:hypothetical protein
MRACRDCRASRVHEVIGRDLDGFAATTWRDAIVVALDVLDPQENEAWAAVTARQKLRSGTRGRLARVARGEVLDR